MPSFAPLPDLRPIVDIIVRDFDPERILVFGSQVRSRREPDGEIDLLVVLKKVLQTSRPDNVPANGKLSVNLVFQTREEINEALSKQNSVLAHLLRNSAEIYPSGQESLWSK